jgi:hypothetical protein
MSDLTIDNLDKRSLLIPDLVGRLEEP